MPSDQQGNPDVADPCMIGRVATSTVDRNGQTHHVRITTETHYDPYEDELGKGVPVYDEWVIDDDQAGDGPDAKYENAGPAAAAGRGFRTPAGRPSSNELWRFRMHGCQDCWAALFFFGLLLVVVLWGSSELYHFSLTEDMVVTLRENFGVSRHRGGGGTNAAAGAEAVKADDDDVVATLPPSVEAVTSPPTRKPSKTNGNRKAADEPKEATILNILFSSWTARRAVWILTWLAISVTVACGGLALFRCIPRLLIVAGCWMEFGLLASLGLVSCLSGNLFAGIMFATLALMPLLWLYLVQDRIPFAVCMLEITSRVLRRHMGLVVVAIAAALVLVLYALLTICFMMPAVLRAAAEVPAAKDGGYLLLLGFTLLWVQQVAANVAHVTASGVVATWYFAGESRMPVNPVRASFKRATTQSIGSICFGSLFVAIVRFLRFLAEAARGGDDGGGGGFCACVCDCFLGLLESLLRYFNIYAFVHVAVYGCSYIDAARRTLALTQQCFFAAVFNECLVYSAVDVLNLMLAACTAGVGGLLCWSVPLGISIFFLSFFINSIVFQLVQSTVTTIFVCFAEVPEGLEISFPELYVELMALDTLGGVAGVHGPSHVNYGTL